MKMAVEEESAVRAAMSMTTLMCVSTRAHRGDARRVKAADAVVNAMRRLRHSLIVTHAGLCCIGKLNGDSRTIVPAVLEGMRAYPSDTVVTQAGLRILKEALLSPRDQMVETPRVAEAVLRAYDTQNGTVKRWVAEACIGLACIDRERLAREHGEMGVQAVSLSCVAMASKSGGDATLVLQGKQWNDGVLDLFPRLRRK